MDILLKAKCPLVDTLTAEVTTRDPPSAVRPYAMQISHKGVPVGRTTYYRHLPTARHAMMRRFIRVAMEIGLIEQLTYLEDNTI